MSEDGWARLRRIFVQDYERLRRQLAIRLGSAEEARDVLHDTFLRLTRDGWQGEEVRNPRQYVYRTALNTATTHKRTEYRRAGIAEMVELAQALEIADSTPGPAEVAEERSDMRRLREVVEQMAPRRKEIFEALVRHGATTRDLAERYGLTMRMIQLEIRKISEEIAQQFDGADVLHFVRPDDETSES